MPIDFTMAREMAGDIQSATQGVYKAYRDFEMHEEFMKEHTRLHVEAEEAGGEYDCSALSREFWSNLSQDVIQSDNEIEKVTHARVLARLLIERKLASGQVEFLMVEPQGEGESDEDFKARVMQAAQDHDDLKLLDPDAEVSETAPMNNEQIGEFMDSFINFMQSSPAMEPDSVIEDPNDPDEKEGN